jgi:hypothetical protein
MAITRIARCEEAPVRISPVHKRNGGIRDAHQKPSSYLARA